jgi:nucleoid-associated protein YgaU
MSSELTYARLYPVGQMANGITFQFNPKLITVSHTATLREIGGKKGQTNDNGMKASGVSVGESTQQVMEKQGATTFKLTELTFDGQRVTADCGTLLNWSYGVPVSGSNKISLPELTFSWGRFSLGQGSATAITVLMTRAEVKYERFDITGTPIRATVSIDLQPVAENPLQQQNPTSGGLPGRSGHLMVSGDTLPGVALAAYGRPGRWRALAEANQLDDPLRVRPGSVLYVPSRSELADGERR